MQRALPHQVPVERFQMAHVESAGVRREDIWRIGRSLIEEGSQATMEHGLLSRKQTMLHGNCHCLSTGVGIKLHENAFNVEAHSPFG